MEITIKNTKQQIFDAYREALDKLEEKKTVTIKDTMKVTREENIKSSAENLISRNILSDEIKKEYEDLKKASSLLTNEIKELYNIEAQANSLEALIISNQEMTAKLSKEYADKNNSLEEEFRNKKKELEEEYLALVKKNKEFVEELKVERERAEEDYQYELKKKRREEEDKWQEEQNALLKKIQDEKDELDSKKAEYDKAIYDAYELKEQIENLKQENEENIQEVLENFKQAHEEKIEKYKQAAQKELEWTKSKYEDKIASLEERLEQEKERSNDLSCQLNKSYAEIREIAVQTVQANGNVKIISDTKNN